VARMVMAPSAVYTPPEEYAVSTNYNTVKPVSDFPSGAHADNGAKVAKEMIGAALQKKIQSVDPHDCEPGEEDAFFVADLGDVYRQHMRWKNHLGRVTPHYAVKCNPDPMVLRLLAALGAGFDCASKAEIE
ncbi:Ornithine, partial [Hortaea werneckii]